MEDLLIPRFNNWRELHAALVSPVAGQLAILNRRPPYTCPFLVEWDGENEEWEYVRDLREDS